MVTLLIFWNRPKRPGLTPKSRKGCIFNLKVFQCQKMHPRLLEGKRAVTQLTAKPSGYPAFARAAVAAAGSKAIATIATGEDVLSENIFAFQNRSVASANFADSLTRSGATVAAAPCSSFFCSGGVFKRPKGFDHTNQSQNSTNTGLMVGRFPLSYV